MRPIAEQAILRKMVLTSVITGLLSLNACSSVIDNLGIEGLEAPELSTTAMGAATGGAVGAGLGLLIGSTTGDAGEGFLIGTGVGALAGAAVGAELELQDEILANHKSTITRQEAEIRQQKEEINRLKQEGMDLSSFQNGRYVIPEQNRPSTVIFGGRVGDASASRSRSYAQGRVVKPRTWNSQNAERIEEDDLLANDLRSRLSPNRNLPVAKVTPTLPAALPATKTVQAVEPRTIVKEPVQIAAKTPRKSPLMQVPQTKKVFASEVTKIEEKNSSIVKDARKEVKQELASMGAAKTTVASTNDGTCMDAESEASRARNAASDTDKLFYYRRALRLCKTKPEYHVEIGRVYASIGRREEAEFEFSRALEIDPENRNAQDELTMLMLNNTY
jgi:outer membrane lipoprotein SlyB